jgi:hypothetical protein
MRYGRRSFQSKKIPSMTGSGELKTLSMTLVMAFPVTLVMTPIASKKTMPSVHFF